jgi:hypothetical protein
MKQVILVFATTIYLLSCQNQPISKWETLKFIQDNPMLTHLNLGDTAHGHGDGMAWEAPLRDTLGNIVGEAMGWTVTVDIMDGDSANPIFLTERNGVSILNFGDENEIIGQGITSYYNGEKRLKLGLSQIYPIVGGTGKYKGVQGEYSVTRQPDSTYVYLLSIKMQH